MAHQSWRKRYFVIQDGVLTYYDKPQGSKKGNMALDTVSWEGASSESICSRLFIPPLHAAAAAFVAQLREIQLVPLPRKPFRFVIKSASRTLFMQVSDAHAVVAWRLPP